MLANAISAPPCMPFAKFALRDPAASSETIKSAIQFMDEGMRGFYCIFVGPKTATIRLGAKVYIVD
jgi:hypothetical protein